MTSKDGRRRNQGIVYNFCLKKILDLHEKLPLLEDSQSDVDCVAKLLMSSWYKKWNKPLSMLSVLPRNQAISVASGLDICMKCLI